MENWKYFTFEEMCASNTAQHTGIVNRPRWEHIKNMNRLVEGTLDPLRALWEAPLIVSSGFRLLLR